MLYLTAAASSFSPSWNVTPGRTLIVSALPSADHVVARRELRHDVELLVDVEQLVAQRREHDAADERARERRIEDVGILGKADAQRLRGRRQRGDGGGKARSTAQAVRAQRIGFMAVRS